MKLTHNPQILGHCVVLKYWYRGKNNKYSNLPWQYRSYSAWVFLSYLLGLQQYEFHPAVKVLLDSCRLESSYISTQTVSINTSVCLTMQLTIMQHNMLHTCTIKSNPAMLPKVSLKMSRNAFAWAWVEASLQATALS